MRTEQTMFILLLTLKPPFATYLTGLFVDSSLAETHILGIAERPCES